MTNPLSPAALRFRFLAACIILFGTYINSSAQSFWDKVPAPTSMCYSDKDNYQSDVERFRSDLKAKIEASKQKAEEKVSKMTEQERMNLAMKYQNMSPAEIMKMQKDMEEMTQSMTTYQQIASEFEEQYNQLESDFRSEFNEKLGKIEEEYKKLPDGEGTPEWAIKKGKELTAKYNLEYEALCARYFTASNSLFQKWLVDFNKFLKETEVPFNEKQIRKQSMQYGIEPDLSVATMMAVDRYLEKCSQVFGLRRSYPQG